MNEGYHGHPSDHSYRVGVTRTEDVIQQRGDHEQACAGGCGVGSDGNHESLGVPPCPPQSVLGAPGKETGVGGGKHGVERGGGKAEYPVTGTVDAGEEVAVRRADEHLLVDVAEHDAADLGEREGKALPTDLFALGKGETWSADDPTKYQRTHQSGAKTGSQKCPPHRSERWFIEYEEHNTHEHDAEHRPQHRQHGRLGKPIHCLKGTCGRNADGDPQEFGQSQEENGLCAHAGHCDVSKKGQEN